MIRITFIVFLLSCSMVAFSQKMVIPAAISTGKNSHLILHTYAKGVQVYVCQQDPKDASHYVWVFKEPRAVLYSDTTYRHAIGKHYFDAAHNPNWESTDGSKVTGAKVAQVNSTDSLAIPWLLLKATNTQGPGTLQATAFIQRILTEGGKAPAKGDKVQLGKVLEVPYKAEYLFYGEN